LLLAIAPRGIPRLAETTLDGTVLWFAVGITVMTGLLAALAPVISAGNFDVYATLKDSGRTAGGGPRRQLLRNGLVVGEVALTFVLAFGASLLMRSLIAAQNASPGFDPQRILAIDLALPSSSYRDANATGQFYRNLLSDLRALPGVHSATTVRCPAGAGDCGDWFYSILGRPNPPRNEVPLAWINTADAGYFSTVGIPILQGREFTSADRAPNGRVAVVNEKFARRWWPHESAIGHQVKIGGPYLDGTVLEIVGVVGDVKRDGLDSQAEPEIYTAFAADPSRSMAVLVRTDGKPEALLGSVRQHIAALDHNLPVQRAVSLEERLGAGLARRRFSALLLSIFAGLAMLLAGIGIYGLLSYWVSVRESEIAIRLALGARPGRIVRWAGLHALRLAAIGMALGAAGAWAASRTVETMVFGIPARNATTFVMAGVAIAALALMAVAPPAWRAARTDAARRLHGA
jgi:predicted permease